MGHLKLVGPTETWLFQRTHEGLLVVDVATGYVTAANPAARLLFGWSPFETVKYDLGGLVAEPSRVLVQDEVEAARGQGPRPGGLEVAILGRAGEEIPVQLMLDPLPSDSGGALLVLVSIRDLRERAQSTARREALLRVARLAAQSDAGQLFDALLAEAVAVLHSDDGGIAEWDAERGVLYQTHTFLPSLSANTVMDGRNSASGRAARLRQPIIVNDYQREIGHATPAGRMGAHAVLAVPLMHADRLLGTLSVSRLRPVHPFGLADAEVLELMASTASATLIGLERARQLRETVEQLQLAKEAAEAADRAKSTFLATMSHELKTPLNAILGYCELLLEEAAARDQQAFMPDLDRILAAGRDLLSLIDSVLDLSAIESGALQLSLEQVPIAPLVDEVVDEARQLVDKRGNLLRVERGSDLGEIWADRARLRQAVLNLLSNASKFTEQGALTLRVAREQADDQEWLSVRVSDTGIGMTAEQLARVSAPFWQADLSATRRYGGAGLGLALTQRLCVLMGGSLLAESEPGVGTAVTVRLPAAPAAARSNASAWSGV